MTSEYDRYSLQPNFKPIDHLFESRLRQFIDKGGHYRNLNLPKFYDYQRVDSNTDYITLHSYKVPDSADGKTQRPIFSDIKWDEVKWSPAKKGQSFGPSWKTFWFKVELRIPNEWIEQSPEAIEFQWDSNSEAMIYSEEGTPLQAFTGGNERTIFSLSKDKWSPETQVYYIEMACNGMTGNGSGGVPDPNRHFQLSKCDLVLPNLEARRLFWDFWIISDGAREFPGNSLQKWQANQLCNDIMNAFNPEDVNSIKECRQIAEKYLGNKINDSEVFTPDAKIDVLGVGNCHIDTAWLWPWAETKRKIVRSWTTQVRIADEYPEYIFVASQMQQFKWLKEYHPEIFEKVKQKFSTNQFLPIGGSWVENDTNLPNGESLIRQFLLGQRYMLDEFGTQSEIFWLPDTFGYSSQIPQICQISGIKKFLTQKLSWNNINQFPLSTFNWAGIDKSQVLVHMPPANTYTANANFGDVVRSLQQHKNLRDVPTGLLLYGHGDGGGGPTEEMIEKLRRCRGLADTSGLIPKVHLGNTVEDFYEDILKRSNDGKDLPTWTGEIYLEFHRGTYTTQAMVKKLMRECEVKLHAVEWAATLVSLTESSYKYPSKSLAALWEDICLCQFHDVLPGSCIGMVYYEEALPMLRKAYERATDLFEEALGALQYSSIGTESISLINTLPWARKEVLKLKKEDAEKIKSFDQLRITGNGDDFLVMAETTAKGNAKFLLPDELKYPARAYKEEDNYVLSNGALKATITEEGIVVSLIDLLNDREIIDNTCTKQTDDDGVAGGNQFVLFDDEPLNFPAWDTELYSLTKFKFLKSEVVRILSNNAFESSILVKTQISKESTLETTISIEGLSDSKISQNNYLKFKCAVHWHETYKFLKVQFPTTIYTAEQAKYETQFGITSRPTHYNTTWDVAKFEVCHHKFMDLSEYNYGVSVVNNCKYGASIHGNLIRLSLLRSPKAPDDRADMGFHEFEYALYPHAGPLGMDTVRLGWNFNYRLEHRLNSPDFKSLFTAVSLDTDDALVLSHLKRSEDDSDVSTHRNIPTTSEVSFIVRVYEALGGSGKGTLTFNPDILDVEAVFEVNALEQIIAPLDVLDGKVDISLRPFQIASYKVVLLS